MANKNTNLWGGRFSKEVSETTNSFNSSIGFDFRLHPQDVYCSIVHAQMLAKQGIITLEDGQAIAKGLGEILADINSGELMPDPTAEDIHMFIEAELTDRIGEAGKRLHTARSRNDQVAVDAKRYVMGCIDNLAKLIDELFKVIVKKAEEYSNVVMPGYTHLQRAQPITFGHHLMAYAQMFMRDQSRLLDCLTRTEQDCPLGSGALAGTTYLIDRFYTAKELGFTTPSINSMDGVSDRDYMLELMSVLSIIMTHLSRFSEEIILWCSWEFRFITLDDAFSTGSSIMPQKKNPDIAELVRGKSGRVYGDLMSLLTAMKGLPLAYNKDMQEDKEAVFDAIDTVTDCLRAFTPMLDTITVNQQVMRRAASNGFINATDAADYLVGKGMAFRDAYTIIGQLVSYCIAEGKTLEQLSLEEYQKLSSSFDEGIYGAIDLDNCVSRRVSYGGTGTVKQQIEDTNKRYSVMLVDWRKNND